MGAWAPLGPIFIYLFIFIVIIFLIFVVRLPSKILDFFFHNKLNWPYPNSNYPTKKLNQKKKNIHNGNYILAKKTFYHQRTKKLCVIREDKAKFFETAVNWYKYQLTVASY